VRSLIIVLFDHNLKHMIKDRADHLGLNIPEYLKYIAVKDIDKAEKNI